MFDITRIADAVGGLVGQSAETPGGDGLLQQLSETGLDPSQLEGLGVQELMDVLEQNGIDASSFDISQISELAGQWSENIDGQSISDLLSNLTKRN